MNIQGPLLILGMTATTSVGLGTVAVNSGAVSIDDVAGLLAETTNAASTALAGATGVFAAPGTPTSTAASSYGSDGQVLASSSSVFGAIIDGTTSTEHGTSGGSITTHEPGTGTWDGNTAGNTNGNSNGGTHGTSSGSTWTEGTTGGTTGGSTGGGSSATGGNNSSGGTHGTSSGSTSSSGGTSAGNSGYEDDDDEHEEDHEDEDDHEEEDDD